MSTMTTGKLIRKARKAKGLSQNQLANELGVTDFLVSHWERGKRNPRDMEAVALALDTTVEAITGIPAEPQKRERADFNMLPAPSLADQESYIGISKARAYIEAALDRKFNNDQIHRFVREKGLPAFVNPLRKNSNGDPTLLFLRSQIREWLDSNIQPVKSTVNQ